MLRLTHTQRRPGRSVEHRTAHCYAPDSEYRLNGGYMIEVSARPFREVRQLVKEATPAQRDAIREGRISDAIAKLRGQVQPSGL